MLTRILAGIALSLGLALAGTGYWLSNVIESRAAARASLATAIEANAALIEDRAQAKVEADRVRAHANRLTLDLRDLTGAVATLKENLSDATKRCPIPDADLRLLQCVLEPGTAGCDKDRAAPPR